MRAVVQRVRRASVTVGPRGIASIGRGLLVLVGVGRDDASEDVRYIANKIAGLRVFEDSEGKMNRSVAEIGGEVLLVSQFTLYGDCRRGRRPSFARAAEGTVARARYEEVAEALVTAGLSVRLGEFQAMMDVELVNAGPVTVLLDSQRAF